MVVDEAHISGEDYKTRKVETLTAEEFKKRFWNLPFKRIGKIGAAYLSLESPYWTRFFDNLEKEIIRYIPFEDKEVDGAVIFNKKGEPIMEMTMVAIRGLGTFYIGSKPGKNKMKNIKRIYEDLKDNPILA